MAIDKVTDFLDALATDKGRRGKWLKDPDDALSDTTLSPSERNALKGKSLKAVQDAVASEEPNSAVAETTATTTRVYSWIKR